MYINRHIEVVVQRIAKRKPVIVLTGARQVGKSTMLNEVCKDIPQISMDNPLVREKAVLNPSLFFDIHKPPVVVNEIQKAGELFEYIKADVDSDKTKKKGQFFLTGSQSLTLMKNVSESLAGRAGIIKLLGLSLRELTWSEFRDPFKPAVHSFEQAQRHIGDMGIERISSYIHKGFFPELHETATDMHDWSDYYSSYFQTYIEKDIATALKIRDESAFIKFVRAVCARSGEMLNYTALAEVCGKDVKTVRSWLSVLESCGLVYLLEPYFNNVNKRMTKTPKLYFLDTGFACWLLGWNTPDQLVNGAMWGHLFETFVVSEILKSYYNDGIVRPPLYYYRDKDKNEIDLLIMEGDTIYPVEIKTTGDPNLHMTKSFRCLEKIPSIRVGTGALVCLVKEVLPLSNDVWAIPVAGI